MRNDFFSDYFEHSAKGSTWEKTDHKYIERKKGKNGKWIYRYTLNSPAAENDRLLYDFNQPTKKLRESKSKAASTIYYSQSNNKNKNYREAEYQGRKAAEEQASRMRGKPFAGYQNSAEYAFKRTPQYKKEMLEKGKRIIMKILTGSFFS